LHWQETYSNYLAVFRKHILAVLPVLFFSAASAMVLPPKAIRACLDPTTGVVTLYFSPQADLCGSFVSYRLYGRDNITSPFQQLFQGGTANTTALSALLPNKKQWELFVSARFACNGIDTLNSDTVFIDDTPPAKLDLDSVSVDLASQQLIAGWQKASEKDVMGYSVFKVDPATGNNILIKDTASLGYWFSTSTFDVKNSGNKTNIAVFDSCYNGGVICAAHSPVCASFSASDNINLPCDKQFTFRWTGYVGWAVDHYDVWVSDDQSNLWSKVGTVSGSTYSYTYAVPVLNRKYYFLVRAYKSPSTASITSSSNIIGAYLSGHDKANTNTIGHVSVVNESSLEITTHWNATLTGYSATLYYRENSSPSWQVFVGVVPKGLSRFKHTGLQTNNTAYQYMLVVKNPCNKPSDSSEEHESILLKRAGFLLQWFDYQPYNAIDQALEARQKQGSTWNVIGGPSSPYILSDTSKPECYRVVAYKKDAGGNRIDTAYSNEVCLRVYDTTLIPNSFAPDGNNRWFRIVNPNIERGQAVMSIYDRWGGKLWQGEALDGWNGEAGGSPVIQGFYIYKVEVVRSEKRELFQGTLMLLR
jgi:gliding motility-associated-like protein